jgi:hypothetical protein
MRSYGTHAPEAHLRNHAFETAAGNRTRRRASKILVDHLDVRKSQITKTPLHCVLQL